MALGEGQSMPPSRTAVAGGILDGTVDLARDRDLVERCQSGERAAFEELYHRYHRRLFHFCLRRLHEPYEAEDAVQEAFARAWRAMPTFGGERRFYPWLTVIAGNVCTDILRRRARLMPVEEVPLPSIDLGAAELDEVVIEQADAALAIEALEHLSERHQRVLQLREGSGWSTQRLAEHEGVAVPAMETLLWRARQALKREFAALAETGGRLGVAVGLGLAALRRFAGRTASRVPAVQTAADVVRSPGAVVAGLAVAGGVVGGAVLVANPHAPSVGAVSMPAAAPAAATATDQQVAAAPAGSSVLATAGSGGGSAPAGSVNPGGPDLPAAAGTAAGPAATSQPASSGGDSAALGTTPNSAVGGVTAGVTSLAGSLGSTASSAAGSLGSTVTSLAGSLGSAASSLAGSATSLPRSLGSAASSAGSAVTGLAGGLGG